MNERMATDGWRPVESPTEKTLFDVTTTRDGPYAVGEDGVVLARTDDWVTVVGTGPATKGNRLTCAASTTEGNRVWFAGDSGALGVYDTRKQRKYDYTAPNEKTSTWEAIIVSGTAADERLHVANGSGELLPIGFDEHGCPRYGEVFKPGGGSTITALAADANTCYVADTSGNVFAGLDDDWRRLGIENAQVNFYDLHAMNGSLLVAGGDGRLHRYDHVCENWTPISVGEESVHALAHERGDAGDERTVAVGASGCIHEQTTDRGWQCLDSPAEGDLWGVTLGTTDVAVGTGGTILERRGRT